LGAGRCEPGHRQQGKQDDRGLKQAKRGLHRYDILIIQFRNQFLRIDCIFDLALPSRHKRNAADFFLGITPDANVTRGRPLISDGKSGKLASRHV
jgi:hypothetical protein